MICLITNPITNPITNLITNNGLINTSKKYSSRFLIFFLSASLCGNSNAIASSAPFSPVQRHAAPPGAARLKVDIFYYRDFPYRQNDVNQKTEGCINIPASGIVRCKELISLLRSEGTVSNWLGIQKEKGYLALTQEPGEARAHISKVTPLVFPEVNPINKNTDLAASPYAQVTGLFIRHVLNVRRYTFKNLATNTVFFVKATPEHPVYSVNRHAFIAISALLPEENLLSSAGDRIRLLCPQGIKNSCGTIADRGKITRVYNIETSQRHTYFVQGEKLLVHNCDGKDKNQSMFSDEHNGENEQIDQSADNRAHPFKKDKVRLVTAPYSDRDLRYLQVTPSEHSLPEVLKTKRNNAGEMEIKQGDSFTRFRVIGIMDYQDHVAPYSKRLLLEDGILLKKRVFGSKVAVLDTMESFKQQYLIDARREARMDFCVALIRPLGILSGTFASIGGLLGGIGILKYYVPKKKPVNPGPAG